MAKLSGWKKLTSCVYERSTGTRIHTCGLVKIGTDFVDVRLRDAWVDYAKHMRIFGGNKRRALMGLAEELERRNEA